MSVDDEEGKPFVGTVFMGHSGRGIKFTWNTVDNAGLYEFRLFHVQKGVVVLQGSTELNEVSLVIPQTGIFRFEVRAKLGVGTTSEQWSEWYSSDADFYSLKRFSAWPAPTGPPIVE